MCQQHFQISLDSGNVLLISFNGVHKGFQHSAAFNHFDDVGVAGFLLCNLLLQASFLCLMLLNCLPLVFVESRYQFSTSVVCKNLFQNGVQDKGFQIFDIDLFTVALLYLPG